MARPPLVLLEPGEVFALPLFLTLELAAETAARLGHPASA